jgi:hypothetical protein
MGVLLNHDKSVKVASLSIQFSLCELGENVIVFVCVKRKRLTGKTRRKTVLI